MKMNNTSNQVHSKSKKNRICDNKKSTNKTKTVENERLSSNSLICIPQVLHHLYINNMNKNISELKLKLVKKEKSDSIDFSMHLWCKATNACSC